MTGKIAGAGRTLSGKLQITITLEDGRPDFINELGDKLLDITLKPWKPKRSKDANAYAWVLMGKIAAKLGTSPQEVYKTLIPDIGDNYDIVCVRDKAVDKLRESWSRQGLGWLTDTMPSKIRDCTNVVLYYGSSVYDTLQMSRLIDLIIREAQLQNIETATPEELARYKEEWK